METRRGKRKKEVVSTGVEEQSGVSTNPQTPRATSAVTSSPLSAVTSHNVDGQKDGGKGDHPTLGESIHGVPGTPVKAQGAQRFSVTSVQSLEASGAHSPLAGWKFDNADLEAGVSESATLPRGRGRGRRRAAGGSRRGSQTAQSDPESDFRSAPIPPGKPGQRQEEIIPAKETASSGSKSRSRSDSRKRLSRFFRRKSRGESEGDGRSKSETAKAEKGRSRSENDLASRRRSKDMRRQSEGGARRCDSVGDVGTRSARDGDAGTSWTLNPRSRLQHMTVREAVMERRLRRTASGSRFPVSGSMQRKASGLRKQADADKESLSSSLPDITLTPPDHPAEESDKPEAAEPEAAEPEAAEPEAAEQEAAAMANTLAASDTAFPRQTTRKSFRDKLRLFTSSKAKDGAKDGDKTKEKESEKEKGKKKDEKNPKEKRKEKEKQSAKSKKEKDASKGRKSGKDKGKSKGGENDEEEDSNVVDSPDVAQEEGTETTNTELLSDVAKVVDDEQREEDIPQDVAADDAVSVAAKPGTDAEKEKRGKRGSEKKKAKELEKAKEKERKEMEKKEKEAREREKRERKEQEKKEKKKLKESKKIKIFVESSDSEEEEKMGRSSSKKSRKLKKKSKKNDKKKLETSPNSDADNVVCEDIDHTVHLDDSVPDISRLRDLPPTVEPKFPWQRDVIESMGEVIVHSPAERPICEPRVDEGGVEEAGEQAPADEAVAMPRVESSQPVQNGSECTDVSEQTVRVGEQTEAVAPFSSPTLEQQNAREENVQEPFPQESVPEMAVLRIDEVAERSLQEVPLSADLKIDSKSKKESEGKKIEEDAKLIKITALPDTNENVLDRPKADNLSEKATLAPAPATTPAMPSAPKPSTIFDSPIPSTKSSPIQVMSSPTTERSRSLSRERSSSDSSLDIFYDAESEPESEPTSTPSKALPLPVATMAGESLLGETSVRSDRRQAALSGKDDPKLTSLVRKPDSLRLPSLTSRSKPAVTAGVCVDAGSDLGDLRTGSQPWQRFKVPTIDVSPSENLGESSKARRSVSSDPDSGVASPGFGGGRSSQSPEPLVPVFDVTKVKVSRSEAAQLGAGEASDKPASSRPQHPLRRSFRRQPKSQGAEADSSVTSSPMTSLPPDPVPTVQNDIASSSTAQSSPMPSSPTPYRTRSLSPSVSAPYSFVPPQDGVTSAEASTRHGGRDSGISLSLDRGDNRVSTPSPESMKTWSATRLSPTTPTASSLLPWPTSPTSSLLSSPSTPSTLLPSPHSLDRSLSEGGAYGVHPHSLLRSPSALSDSRDYAEPSLSPSGEGDISTGQAGGAEVVDAKSVPVMGTSIQQRYRRTFSPQRGRAGQGRDNVPQSDQDRQEGNGHVVNGYDAASARPVAHGPDVIPGNDVTLNRDGTLDRDIPAIRSSSSAIGKSAADPRNLDVEVPSKPEVKIRLTASPCVEGTSSRHLTPDDNEALLRAAIADSFEMARRGRDSQSRRSHARPSRSFRRKSPEEEAKAKAVEEEAAKPVVDEKVMYDKSTQTSEINLYEKAGKKKKEKKKKKDKENGVLGLMRKKKDKEEEETTVAPTEEPPAEVLRVLASAEEPRTGDVTDGQPYTPLLEEEKGEEDVSPHPDTAGTDAGDEESPSDEEDHSPPAKSKKTGLGTLALLKQKFSRRRKVKEKNKENKAREEADTFVFIENEVNLSKLAEIKETDILEDDVIEPLMGGPLPRKELRFQPLPPDEAVQKEEPLPPFSHSQATNLRRRESTIREKRKEVVHCCKKFIAFLFSHIGLCSLVVGYTILGGVIFKAIEGPEEEALRSNIKGKRSILIEKLLSDAVELQLRKMGEENFTRSVELRLLQFQEDIHDATKNKGWDGKDEVDGQNNKDSQWSFASSLLYAITVMTTIGYGHVAPKTAQGRIVTIGYAVLGIPLTLLCLTNIGDVMATGFRLLYGKVCCGVCCKLFRPARRHRHPDLEKGLRRQVLAAEAEEDKAKEVTHVPTSLCILLIAAYIFLGAILFALWEGWDFLTGSYFCFITLSTIGFGDIVPGMDLNAWSQQEKLVLCALYLVFGLSLIAMCFNLVQEDVKAKCRWLGMKMGIIDKPKAPDREGRIQSQAIKSQSNNKLDAP